MANSFTTARVIDAPRVARAVLIFAQTVSFLTFREKLVAAASDIERNHVNDPVTRRRLHRFASEEPGVVHEKEVVLDCGLGVTVDRRHIDVLEASFCLRSRSAASEADPSPVSFRTPPTGPGMPKFAFSGRPLTDGPLKSIVGRQTCCSFPPIMNPMLRRCSSFSTFSM